MASAIRKFWIILFSLGIVQAYRLEDDEFTRMKEVRTIELTVISFWCTPSELRPNQLTYQIEKAFKLVNSNYSHIECQCS